MSGTCARRPPSCPCCRRRHPRRQQRPQSAGLLAVSHSNKGPLPLCRAPCGGCTGTLVPLLFPAPQTTARAAERSTSGGELAWPLCCVPCAGCTGLLVAMMGCAVSRGRLLSHTADPETCPCRLRPHGQGCIAGCAPRLPCSTAADSVGRGGWHSTSDHSEACCTSAKALLPSILQHCSSSGVEGSCAGSKRAAQALAGSMLRPFCSVPHTLKSALAKRCMGSLIAECQVDAVQSSGVPAAVQEGRFRAQVPHQVLKHS